jgi:molybdopterin-binding protein
MAHEKPGSVARRLRIGEAAEMLGVSSDTVRRWIDGGRLPSERTPGGQRLVPDSAVAALAARRRRGLGDRPIVAQSARNRFPGVVVSVERDRVAAVVEVRAGPHRLVSLLTREAAEELELAPGRRVVCVVKSTDVMVEVPAERSAR